MQQHRVPTLTELALEDSLKGRLVAAGQLLQCKALSDKLNTNAAHLFAQRFPQSIYREAVIKAAVPGSSLTTGNTSALAPSALSTAIATFADQISIFGRLKQYATVVPFGVAAGEGAAASGATWITGGRPIPLIAGSFETATLQPFVLASLAVITEDLARATDARSSALVSRLVARVIAEAVDSDVLDRSNTGIVDVKPASILAQGSPALDATGTDAAAAKADIIALLTEAKDGRSIRLSTSVLLMNSIVSCALSSFGRPFDQLGIRGGTLFDIPVLAGEGVDPTVIALVDASRIVISDSDDVQVDVAGEGALQFLDHPTNNAITATATSGISLYQTNSIAFRATRVVNWAALPESVILLTDCNYQGSGSPA